jgi:hypothetical protein
VFEGLCIDPLSFVEDLLDPKEYLSRSITNRHKSNDIFHRNNSTEAELGFCGRTELYTGCRRNRRIHMHV